MQAVDQRDAAYQANGGAWPQLQDTCALCHGASGQPRDAQYAALAGQPTAYIENQLRAFAEGRRHSAQMQPLAANLTDEQIKRLASYSAEQQPGVTEAPPRMMRWTSAASAWSPPMVVQPATAKNSLAAPWLRVSPDKGSFI
ncbi:c-type cytochrome [Pseudomonas sp. R1-1]